jgi:hypothetical protein
MTESNDNRALDWFTPCRFGVLLAVLVFASFPQVILGLQTFVFRDYGFFAYPLAHFQRDCFWRGEIPLWNPYNFCGIPFLAQWNTMPLYPPSLIYLTLPLQWSLGFFCLLHLWFAGLGMFFLARRWTGLRRAEVSASLNGFNSSPASVQLSCNAATATQAGSNFAAAFAGTVFAFNGFTLNLLMWPSHLATFAWMPWVVLAVELAWRDGGRKIFLAALVGAMQMLAGGPEIIFFTWILLLAIWVQQLIARGGDASSPTSATGASQPSRGKIFWRFPVVAALVFALTAIQLLPFLDLAAHSQRDSGYADLRWSLPLRGWANFLVPMAFGNTWDTGVFFQHGQGWTSSYYLGIGALWLALLAVPCVRERRVWLLGATAAVAYVFALGDGTPIYPALRKVLPQLSLVTYPVKFTIIIAFAAPVLAAFALANVKRIKKQLLLLGAILFALVVGIIFWTQHAPMLGDQPRASLLNGISRAEFLILTGAILLVLARKSSAGIFRAAPVALILIAWLDVFTHEPAQNPTVPPAVYAPGFLNQMHKLQPLPALGGSRAMVTPMAAAMFVHTPLGDPQNNFLANRLGCSEDCNLLDGVPKTDGFFSLVPREGEALAFWFYGATNNNFPHLEDFMGVSQITAPDRIYAMQPRTTFLPLVTAGQNPVYLSDADTLNALIEPEFDGSKMVILSPDEKPLVTVTHQTSARILDSKFTDQTVDIEAEAAEPSLVVIAQTYYHDWRVEVDGQPSPLLRANEGFQAVQIPSGRHHIRLTYADRAFQTGAAISIPAWLACLACLLLVKTKS